MRQKAWLVLRRLAERPGVLSSADELHTAAWPGLAVTPQTLTNVIGELRKIARLDPTGSIRIETRYGQGYRLVLGDVAPQPLDAPEAVPAAIFVGREHELTRLRELWRTALGGTRQVVLVGGTAGIGKTTLVEHFAGGLGGETAVALGRGRCVVRRAHVESYAPLLDALEQISREVDLVDELRRYAPSWLAQMPWLLPASEMMALRQSLAGMGSNRLLREGVRLLEEISARIPLVLVLEDVHAADASTVDLLSALLERTTPARLLVLASYRSPDAFLQSGALSGVPHAMWRLPTVTRMVLEPLSAAAIRSYLARRLDGAELGPATTNALEEKSGGNPLFLREIVDTLVERGLLVEGERGWRLEAEPADVSTMLPEGVRDLIGEHLAQLPAGEIELLEAAAAVGTEFTSSLVAAALDRKGEDVARLCRTPALVPFVVADGERAMPDGSVVDALRFTHGLHQQALAERPTASTRRHLHARIGEQLEREYGARAGEVASRLAHHFDVAELREKQVLYLQLAAWGAAQRCAWSETAELVQRAIEATRLLPDGAGADVQRVELLLAAGNVSFVLGGMLDRRAKQAFDDAHAEARGLGDDVLLFRAQLGRCVCAVFRGSPETVAVAADLIRIAATGHPELAAVAHLYHSYAAHGRGEFVVSAESARRAQATLPDAAPGIPREVCLEAHVLAQVARALAIGGDLDEMARCCEQAAAVARARANPTDRVHTLGNLASVAVLAGDARLALAFADEALALGEEHGLDRHPIPGLAAACRAWARCRLGSGTTEDLAREVDRREQSGELWYQPLLLVGLAELQIGEDGVEAARATLGRAAPGREGTWHAELLRIEGEVALAAGDRSAAGRCFEEALGLARAQGARLFEDRARAALGREGKP